MKEAIQATEKNLNTRKFVNQQSREKDIANFANYEHTGAKSS